MVFSVHLKRESVSVKKIFSVLSNNFTQTRLLPLKAAILDTFMIFPYPILDMSLYAAFEQI